MTPYEEYLAIQTDLSEMEANGSLTEAIENDLVDRLERLWHRISENDRKAIDAMRPDLRRKIETSPWTVSVEVDKENPDVMNVTITLPMPPVFVSINIDLDNFEKSPPEWAG